MCNNGISSKMAAITEDIIIILLFVVRGSVTGEELYTSPRHYVLNLNQSGWHDAKEICELRGGRLATLYDIATLPDLELQPAMSGTDGLIWIGLQRTSSVTVNWSWQYPEDKVTWYNWHYQGTDGILSDVECVAVSVSSPYGWHVTECSRRLPHLCQYKDEGRCQFRAFENWTITAYNYVYMYQKTLEDCKKFCIQEAGNTCQSFDYRPNDGICQFNSGNRWTLADYYAFTNGWVYYHRTCNSGEVTGELSIFPSSAMDITSTYFSQSPDDWEINGISVSTSRTKPVLISSFNDVTRTPYTAITHDVIITHTVLVTQNVYNTHNVTSTVTEYMTSYVTVVQTSTTVVQWTPISTNISEENYTDPVHGLREMGEQAMERKKAMTKISVYEKRASAKFMGYVAIIFIVCSVGSLVVFDMLSICQKVKCCNAKNGQRIAYRKKGSITKRENRKATNDMIRQKYNGENERGARDDGAEMWGQ